MKICRPLLVLLLLFTLQACSTGRGTLPGSAGDGAAGQRDGRATPALAARLDRQLGARPQLPQPDAVIKIDPGSSALSPEMRTRLAAIARLAREDERSTLRLEGYVPDGGSPAWNIGAAERSLRLVREQLEALRVPARRIQIAAFGEEHELQRDERRHWVEIYLLRARR